MSIPEILLNIMGHFFCKVSYSKYEHILKDVFGPVVLNGGHAVFCRRHRQKLEKWGAMETVKWATKLLLLK
jgi:hypothetical protein